MESKLLQLKLPWVISGVYARIHIEELRKTVKLNNRVTLHNITEYELYFTMWIFIIV